MRLTLYRARRTARAPTAADRVVYDLDAGEAHSAGARRGRVLVWELTEDEPAGALLSAEVALDPATEWLLRCDRVDFPPGGVAYRHTHPGPGIRYLLFGSIWRSTRRRASTRTARASRGSSAAPTRCSPRPRRTSRRRSCA